jgi:hypothetical protein
MSLCSWWLQYRKLQVMFKASPASPQTFIDTPNCVLEDSVRCSCAHFSRAQALWWADDSNPFPHILLLVKAHLFFVIQRSETVYWNVSLQSFKPEHFAGFSSFESTKCAIYFIFFDFCRTNILSWEVIIMRNIITSFFCPPVLTCIGFW